MKIWKAIVILMALIIVWALISKFVNRDPLISPIVINPVKQVYAESISCENPKGYLECKVYAGVITWEDHEKLSKIIDCESKWNPNALGVNKSGSVDRGIFQINNRFHPKLTNEQAFDFKKNIDYGIKLYKAQGVNPWTCKYVL